MIKELEHLTEIQEKRFYRMLTAELLKQFASSWYEADESKKLQMHFQEWKSGDRGDYHIVLDRILANIVDELDLGITLTWRQMKINYRRWKVCPVCNRPFLCYSKFNKVMTCYLDDYIRFKVGEESSDGERYIEGRYFKASEDGMSYCYMVYQATMKRKRRHNNEEYEFGYVKPF